MQAKKPALIEFSVASSEEGHLQTINDDDYSVISDS